MDIRRKIRGLQGWATRRRRRMLFKVSKRLILILTMQAFFLLGSCLLLVFSYNQSAEAQQDHLVYQLNATVIANARFLMNTLGVATQFPIARSPAKFEDRLYQFLQSPEWIRNSFAEFSRVFENRASELILQFPLIDSVFLFSPQGEPLAYKVTELYYKEIGSCADCSWREELLNARGQLCVLTEEELESVGCVNRSSGAAIIYAGRALYDSNTFKPLCIVVMGIKATDVLADFGKQKLFPNQTLSLYGDTGILLTGTADGEPEELPERIRESSPGRFVDGEGVVRHVSRDSASGIYSVIRTPEGVLSAAQDKRGLISGIAGILLILSNLLIFGMVIRKITDPLGKLVAACGKVGGGRLPVRVDYDSEDELGYVTEAFNRMSAQVEHLINEVYARKLAERDLELQMLRSQINPHFLYNTLESMRMSAYTKGFTEYAEMCRLLAGVLRYGVSLANHIVSVQEELEHLEDYIALLRYRFQGRVRASILVDEACREMKIIKLILQPVVENCVNHGFGGEVQEGEIMIWGYREENSLIFNVSDNGSGMSGETLRLLRGYINNENDAFHSIGLKNIQRRIKLYYGEEYGLSIDSRPGKGASVTIRLPIRDEDAGREKEALYGESAVSHPDRG